jgi:hypothetical protein
MLKETLLSLSLGFFFATQTFGTTRHVPSQYATIQAAIDACVNGDTVLVAPGVYYENITFRDKNIVVTSEYALTGNVQDILTTVIDGSQPVNPDTASVVRIMGGQDSAAVLQGFTITGGTGTKWPDEHSPGTFREGGGILVVMCSPTIKNNYIVRNEAVSTTGGLVSAGGGGIRAGDGNPHILNNVITRNRGLYGAGIVLNYTGVVLRNNVIAYNTGGEHYGGGGVWINNNGTYPRILENNTIVGNISIGGGGGIQLFTASTVTMRNSIVRRNFGSPGPQIRGTMTVSYSNIEGGYSGTGNIDADAAWADSNAYLQLSSACVDAGDTTASYDDPENPGLPGMAEWPSLGTLRNDMGAYGGPDRTDLPSFSVAGYYTSATSLSFGTASQGEMRTASLPVYNVGTRALVLDSAVIKNHINGILVTTALPMTIGPLGVDTIKVSWTPDSVGSLRDTLVVYHKDTTSASPRQYRLSITVVTGIDDNESPDRFELYPNHPNPFNPSTGISYQLSMNNEASLRIFNLLGREVRMLLHGFQTSGRHEVVWDGRDNFGNAVASGVYLYRLESGRFVKTRKLMLLK